jgi:hypothetical protein
VVSVDGAQHLARERLAAALPSRWQQLAAAGRRAEQIDGVVVGEEAPTLAAVA